LHENSKDSPGAPWRRSAPGLGTGDAPRTPLGHTVASRYAALSERIQEELRLYGPEGHPPSSACRLQALYVDFGQVTLAQDLAEPLLRTVAEPLGAPESPQDRHFSDDERGVFGDFDDTDAADLRRHMARLSRRALMTALVFNAHFWNVRLALEVVAGERPLERAALGTCAFVAERRAGRAVGGDLRYYAPLRERQPAFCSDHCLPAIGPRSSDDRPCLPPRTSENCGMLWILEGFRFFASFPDE
jgi:hypothetical protein